MDRALINTRRSKFEYKTGMTLDEMTVKNEIMLLSLPDILLSNLNKRPENRSLYVIPLRRDLKARGSDGTD